MEPPPVEKEEEEEECFVIRIPIEFESTMQFKASSLRASPGVRTEWHVFQVGSPPSRALLEILPDTPGGNRYGRLLINMCHQNILHWEFGNAGPPFEENDLKFHPIFIRYVEGTLYDFCGPESSCLIGVGSLAPSSLLVQIARDIIRGLSYMHMEGEYHGNISVGTTFYRREWNGGITVQLANFGFKEIPLKEAQRDDWRDFGKMLLEMENEISAYNSCHTSILVDFANLFINTNEDDLDTIKQKAHKHTFFSDTRSRRFVSSCVSLTLKDPQFCESLRENSSKICPLNWGCPDYYTLLPAVNHCRQMDYGQAPYEEKDFTDVVKFVGFICDLYEYCRGIEVPEVGTKYMPAQMDELIISKHPRLHHELRKLMLEFASPEEKSHFGFFCPDNNQ